MDSKGRVLIPSHLRNLFELNRGNELRLFTNEKKEIIAVPFTKNVSRSLKKISKVLEKDGVNILDSQVQVMKDKFEWSILADTNNNRNLKKLKKRISSIKNVKNVKINSE